MKPKILCLPGSPRAHSTNAALLNHFALAAEKLATVEVYRDLARLPIFNPDLEGLALPDIIGSLETRIRSADGLVIACPEYAHGIPGGFKNLLDWLVSGDALYDKPTILIHANGRGRGAFVRAALIEVLKTVGVNLIDTDAMSVYLVSKSPDAANEMLSEHENRAKLAKAARQFVEKLI